MVMMMPPNMLPTKYTGNTVTEEVPDTINTMPVVKHGVFNRICSFLYSFATGGTSKKRKLPMEYAGSDTGAGAGFSPFGATSSPSSQFYFGQNSAGSIHHPFAGSTDEKAGTSKKRKLSMENAGNKTTAGDSSFSSHEKAAGDSSFSSHEKATGGSSISAYEKAGTLKKMAARDNSFSSYEKATGGSSISSYEKAGTLKKKATGDSSISSYEKVGTSKKMGARDSSFSSYETGTGGGGGYSLVTHNKAGTLKKNEKKAPNPASVVDLTEDEDIKVKIEQNGIRHFNVCACSTFPTGNSKSNINNYISPTKKNKTFCLYVDSQNGKPTMAFSGNIPKLFQVRPDAFDDLLKDHDATSSSGANKGACKNTILNLAKIDGTLLLSGGKGDGKVYVIAGDSQTIATGIQDLLDHKFVSKETYSKVGKLKFEDKDFVLVFLPVDGSQTADIFFYYYKGNCYRENGKTGKAAKEVMEIFPTPPSL